MQNYQDLTDSSPATGKLLSEFPGVTIDKRRLPQSKLTTRSIPAYVGEWLLDRIVPGMGDLTEQEQRKISEWSAKFVPSANDQQIIKHRLGQGETVTLLTPVQVRMSFNKGEWEQRASLPNISLDEVGISNDLLVEYPDLLRQGMWGVVELATLGEMNAILSFKPMQAVVNLEMFKEARGQFTFREWRRVLMLSAGYAPEFFDDDATSLILARLLPLVQKSMHQVELAPKATGKSYLYENISSQIRLVSGGNITPAVLFVNNNSREWGLLAKYKAVVLDEIQTLKFSQPDEIVGGLKGFLANAQLTRGGLHQTGSDCSFVMLANVALDQHQQPIYQAHLLEKLPAFLHETAFLDRLKGILPGWELPKLSPLAFANDVGLKSDFFGDVLVALRNDTSFDQYVANRVQFDGSNEYTRNTTSVRDITSGLMKLQFPNGEISDDELERYCLQPAIRMRQLVWDQLYTLDAEFRQYNSTLQYSVRRARPTPKELGFEIPF